MDESMETFVPLTFRRRGVQRVAADDRHIHDVTLLDGVARAFYWQHLLDTGAMQSGSAIARAEKLHHSVVNELLRLTLMWFQRNRLMVDWQAQRQLMATFEEDV